MRLIDADELLKKFGISENFDCDKCNYCDLGIMCIEKIEVSELCGAIEDMPTVEPKKAEWGDYPQTEWLVHCTSCFFATTKNNKLRYNFCPHCGADMRGETNET